MKALVLGGGGFIGSHIVDQLVNSGHMVRVFSKTNESFRKPLSGVEYICEKFENTQALAESLNDVDVVFHSISSSVPSTSNIDPVSDVSVNLIGTINLLNLMRKMSVKKIVYLSSGGVVYGRPEIMPIPETHPLRPICSYGVVKVAIENYLFMYNQLYEIDYVVIRGANAYGERQSNVGLQGLIGSYMNNIINGQPVEIWGDGNVIRDYIYVGDLAALSVLAAESKSVGVFNAGSGEGHSINFIVKTLAEVTGREIKPVYRPGRKYDVPYVTLDIERAKRVYSWIPKVSLFEGVNRTWKWFEENYGYN